MKTRFLKKRAFTIIGTILCLFGGFAGSVLVETASAPAATASSWLSGPPGSFAKLAKEASPSVVNISTVKVVKGKSPFFFGNPFSEEDPLKDFFERFFGDQIPKDFRQRSLGSGFVIDPDGFILTNNHVVEKTDEIKVILADEKEFDAEVVGRDPKTDLALIRIKADRPLKALPLGDSEKLEVGDWVVAIGNPFGLGHTVTAGIVSAKYRHIGASSYDNFIQTDASINPGNSGGPLLNTAGEVVGINSAIFTRSGGSIGIGFAIPVNMAKDLLPQLKKGKVVRGWLGVVIQKVTPDLKDKLGLQDTKGALVADVLADGPAKKAGIQRGDVITTFDGKEIKEMNELPYIVGATPVGSDVTVEVVRDGKKKVFQVKIGKLEEGEAPQAVEEPEPELGMSVEELTPQLARKFGLSDSAGLVVVQIEPNSPAQEAGLRPGDLILEMDQKPVKDIEEFSKKVGKYKVGDTILFLVKREKATLFLTLKVRD